MSYTETPKTPPRNSRQDVGEFDFNEVFAKNNGAINNTPERPIIPRNIGHRNIGKKGINTGKPPMNFDQYLSAVARANKKGGKTRKRKTRSRKHKKSHKKSHKKKSHKKTNRKSKKSRK
tara:strand:- start:211 stop:567 length:357 start_codon:yes stop_codon:yes gene_type:complete